MRIALCVVSYAAGALGLFPGAAGAQEPSPPQRLLTLAEARALARSRSPDASAARHAVVAAQGRERQAGAWPNPTVAYGREQTSGAGDTIAQDILSLQQAVEVGGQRGARREAARFARAATEARVAATEARVDFEVTRTYAAAVAAQRRATFAEEAAASFARAERASQARLDGGDVSGYQHRRLSLEAARYETGRLSAVVVRDSARSALASLLGLADSAGVVWSLVLVDTLTPVPLAGPIDSLVSLALAQRPELRALELDADAGTAEARLASAERTPTPVLSGGYKREQVNGAELSGFVAGVSLPLPLWDRRAGAVSAARADAGRWDSEVESARRQTAAEVRAAYEAQQALAAALAVLSGALGENAATARRAAEAAYGEGEIGLLEWLDSVRAYQEAETTYAILWAEYIARRAALQRAIGAKPS